MIFSAFLLLFPVLQSQILLEEDGQIFLSLQGGSSRKLFAKGEHAAWSPDHSRVVFAKDGKILVRDLDGREKELWTVSKEEEVTGLSWGPAAAQARTGLDLPTLAGSSILFSVEDRDGSAIFQIIPERLSKPERIGWLAGCTGLRFAEVAAPAWSPSGRFLAFTVNGDIWLADKVEPEEGGAGGWNCSRLLPTAQYDGGTYYGSHWTSIVDLIEWAPDEDSIAYHKTRIGGSGIDELYTLPIKFEEDRPSAGESKQVSEEARGFYFGIDGTLHYCEGGEWKEKAQSE